MRPSEHEPSRSPDSSPRLRDLSGQVAQRAAREVRAALRPFTIPNGITLLRIALTPFFVLAAVSGNHVVALGLFVVAGLCEIGGGYLVWLWFREGRPLGYGIAGAAILILYGIIPTFQPAHFGRVYAAYGGMFIVLSLLWGWAMDGMRPDRFDIMGGALCLVGMAVIVYAPRG